VSDTRAAAQTAKKAAAVTDPTTGLANGPSGSTRPLEVSAGAGAGRGLAKVARMAVTTPQPRPSWLIKRKARPGPRRDGIAGGGGFAHSSSPTSSPAAGARTQRGVSVIHRVASPAADALGVHGWPGRGRPRRG